MAKVKISEFSSIPANNTDIDGINLAEGCAPSGINDAIRELMAQLKDFQAGTAGDSFNGPIGTTTAAAGAFTTLTTSSTVTHNGGTANGVAYLNGSKVLTTGSALTFDGSSFAVTLASTTTPSVRLYYNGSSQYGLHSMNANGDYVLESPALNGVTSGNLYLKGNAAMLFGTAGSEQMRLTSTGLGIGTSSPAYKLHVSGESLVTGKSYIGASSVYLDFSSGGLTFATANTVKATLDSSGNLGLGVTPSAWSGFKAFEVASAGSAIWSSGVTDIRMSANMYYNGAYRYAGTGAATRYEQSSGQHAWLTAPSGTAGNAISFTQAMTLDASGNLGVGTTSPGVRLDVRGDSPTIQVGQAGSGNGANFGWVNGDGTVRLNTTGAAWPILFLQNGTERARIDSSGRLLVGTTVTNFGSMITAFSASSYTFESQRSTTGSEGHIAFVNANGAVGTIFTNGTSTAYNTSSDYRLKNITGPITNSGAYIDSLNPVEGTWKADGSTFVGLIAHEAQEASRTPVATGTKDGEQMQGMDYSSPEIIANLIAEVKSLRARLAAANI